MIAGLEAMALMLNAVMDLGLFSRHSATCDA